MSEISYEAVNDSGKRQSFDTGSVRDSRDGKGRYDLVPPIAMRRLAKHYENGAVKYGDRNWEGGQPMSRYWDSMVRHAFNYLEGDRSEDHLAAVAWNAFAMMHTEVAVSRGLLPISLMDMPDYKGIQKGLMEEAVVSNDAANP